MDWTGVAGSLGSGTMDMKGEKEDNRQGRGRESRQDHSLVSGSGSERLHHLLRQDKQGKSQVRVTVR